MRQQLTIPVRLVWGSKDPVFNDDFADDLLQRFRNVFLHRIAGAGHLAVLETSIATMIEVAIAESAEDHHAESHNPPSSTSEMLWSRIPTLPGSPRASDIAICDAAADESLTHSEFESRVATYASAFSARGISLGDRVAVLVPPSVDLVAVIYALWRIGAVTVVADRGLGLRGLRHAVRSARVQHVVGIRNALVAARVLRWAPRARFISVSSLQSAPQVLLLSQVTSTAPTLSDNAAVLFTSGATGPAKGVRYTHQQLCAQRDALQDTYGITSDDSFVAAFAPFALFGPALGIRTGLADMDVTAPGTLTAQALNDACARVHATMVFASPAALVNVLRTSGAGFEALALVPHLSTALFSLPPIPLVMM